MGRTTRQIGNIYDSVQTDWRAARNERGLNGGELSSERLRANIMEASI